jgi:ketosteroid isomerase-like protein
LKEGPPVSPEEEVADALSYFVRVFNDLKWDDFLSCFAEDATVFSPFPDLHRRSEGLEELERGWRPIFDERRANWPGPPYLNIDPVDVQMRAIGDAAVLVTFHLENLFGATVLNRRTLLFEKRDGRWVIAHLHASRGTLEG